MTKLEFMKELESLLSDIPLEERDEALQYYNGYFDDAGEDQEQEIAKELGSPARVASIIKADLNANAADRDNMGCFTEKGYQDTSYSDEKFELIGAAKKDSGNRQANNSNANNNSNSDSNTNSNYNTNTNNNTNYNYSSGQNQNNRSGQSQNNRYDQTMKAANDRERNTRIALIIVLCFFGSPIILSAFGIAIGIISAIIGIIIGFAAAGAGMMIGGIVLIVLGLVQISIPFMALLLCGSGLLVFGLGMMFLLVCVLLCKNVLPGFIKGIVYVCKRPFQNRSVTA